MQLLWCLRHTDRRDTICSCYYHPQQSTCQQHTKSTKRHLNSVDLLQPNTIDTTQTYFEADRYLGDTTCTPGCLCRRHTCRSDMPCKTADRTLEPKILHRNHCIGYSSKTDQANMGCKQSTEWTWIPIPEGKEHTHWLPMHFDRAQRDMVCTSFVSRHSDTCLRRNSDTTPNSRFRIGQLWLKIYQFHTLCIQWHLHCLERYRQRTSYMPFALS